MNFKKLSNKKLSSTYEGRYNIVCEKFKWAKIESNVKHMNYIDSKK